MDVLGINSYWGWYDKIEFGKGPVPGGGGQDRVRLPGSRSTWRRCGRCSAAVLAKKANLALLLTEFGADSVPGYFSASRDLWSEDYHADLLGEILALAGEYPQIAGTFPFCFSDYRDPSKVPNGYWNELNLKGLVDYQRNRKLAFSAVQVHYTRSNSET